MTLYTTITQPLLSLGSDKYLHFVVCQLMAFVLTLLLPSPLLALAITMFVAVVIKEVIIDYLLRMTLCDWQDIVADLIGTAVGIAMASM